MAIDYGTCISVTDDLPRRWKYSTGTQVIAEALYRRWSTDRGSLPYDPNYGENVRDMIGETMSASLVASWQSRIALEALKDERVEDCRVSVVYTPATQTATITASVTPSGASPFRLVLAVTDVTVALLKVT